MDEIFKTQIVKDILMCYSTNKKSCLRFHVIKKELNKNKNKKYYDTQILRALKKLDNLKILNKIEKKPPKGRTKVYYNLSPDYSMTIMQSQLSWLIEAYYPTDIVSWRNCYIFGLPSETFQPVSENNILTGNEQTRSLSITPKDIFDYEIPDSLSKEELDLHVEKHFKNKTKEELLEDIKGLVAVSNAYHNLTWNHMTPYEVCEKITTKIKKVRDKYRLTLIWNEYGGELMNVEDEELNIHLKDFKDYYSYALNTHFESEISKYTWQMGAGDIQFPFITEEGMPEGTTHPDYSKVSVWHDDIIQFLRDLKKAVIEKAEDRLTTPITIFSTDLMMGIDKSAWDLAQNFKEIEKGNMN